ncbi:6-carboxytetrahydropterin synthase [Fusibacter sp. 3D3]|uniref:6-pyruvoyl trahydropterin synthase family protein n=1 Tax=Fusibacter sp. 3D3 TaxID=1048380 RepID=UPI000853BD8C|nr:6-carboxytetrahydropterin synthase [Fusibacter sp. 3D3]GAU76705.1 queuosine biosynthesis QueD [Fusibacter sp. 3D3]
MYFLKCEHSFDSAHFLKDYQGKCANIHGHRWRVVAEIYSEKLVEEGILRGMIVDFGDLKRDLKIEVDYFDHALIIEKGSMKAKTLACLIEDDFRVIEVMFRPTAESFSAHFYDQMTRRGYSVKSIEVYETPTNCASFEGVTL